MLEKAYQAHRYYHEKGKPAPSRDVGIDELAYFGGRTAVIKQEDGTPNPPPPPPIALPAAPFIQPSQVSIAPRPIPETISSMAMSLPPLTYPVTSHAKPQTQDPNRLRLPPLNVPVAVSSLHSVRPQVRERDQPT